MTCEICAKNPPSHFYWHRSPAGWRAIDFCADCVNGVDECVLPDYLVQRVLKGNSHNLALMFATATPPMSNSDREFLQGTHETGKKYISQLARFPNDPRAMVSCKGDVIKICEQEGWACEGLVNVKGNDFGKSPPKSIDVAEDLVQFHMERAIDKDPGLATLPREEVREKVRNRIKPHWSKS